MPDPRQAARPFALVAIALLVAACSSASRDGGNDTGPFGGTGGSAGGPAGGSGGVGGAGGMAGTSGVGGTGDDGGAPDAGSDAALADAGPGELDFWPNPESQANSDAWLREHHASLRVLEPRVLVLDVQRTGDPIEDVVAEIVAAVAEGSRHHAYANAQAPAFLQYQIDKIVDLRDPTAEYPDFWPPEPFDLGELFTTDFAPRYGYKDPVDGHDLTLCEIFERGLVNEIWIAAEAGVRNVYENQSYVQRYDDDLQPIPDDFSTCTNGCFHDPMDRVNCKVSVRVQEVNKDRGVGCFTHAQGHAWENELGRIPYLRLNASRFFYFGMEQRYGIGYDRLYDMACAGNQDSTVFASNGCLSFPEATHLVFDPKDAQEPSVDFDGFGQGCGDVHHPANIAWSNSLVAATACEGYGLGQGSNGADATTDFTLQRAHDLFSGQDDDCGGHWQLYMRQSMPGLGTQAKAEDGSPMLNWWTFWYY